MRSLTALYGQPHQSTLQRIAELMHGPKIKSGGTKSFRLLALKVRALVGMLDQLGADGKDGRNSNTGHMFHIFSPNCLMT